LRPRRREHPRDVDCGPLAARRAARLVPVLALLGRGSVSHEAPLPERRRPRLAVEELLDRRPRARAAQAAQEDARGRSMTSGVRTRVAYGRVLIVEDQFAMYRCVARIVSRYRPVRHAESYEKAVHELSARRDWCGFLFDVSLGDHGNGGFELAQLA